MAVSTDPLDDALLERAELAGKRIHFQAQHKTLADIPVEHLEGPEDYRFPSLESNFEPVWIPDYDLQVGQRGYESMAPRDPVLRFNLYLRSLLKRSFEYPAVLQRFFENDQPLAVILDLAQNAEARSAANPKRPTNDLRVIVDTDRLSQWLFSSIRSETQLRAMGEVDLIRDLGNVENIPPVTTDPDLIPRTRQASIVWAMIKKLAAPAPGCK